MNLSERVRLPKGAKLFECQRPIDEKHLDCLWYGGRVAEMAYKDYLFTLGAYGDVRATLLDDNNNEVVEVRDKSNNGRFYEEMRSYIADDSELWKLYQEGRLVFENNNWWEVLIDAPDGTQHDLGWVCNDDNLIEALREMLDGMDEVITDIEKIKGEKNES